MVMVLPRARTRSARNFVNFRVEFPTVEPPASSLVTRAYGLGENRNKRRATACRMLAPAQVDRHGLRLGRGRRRDASRRCDRAHRRSSYDWPKAARHGLLA